MAVVHWLARQDPEALQVYSEGQTSAGTAVASHNPQIMVEVLQWLVLVHTVISVSVVQAWVSH